MKYEQFLNERISKSELQKAEDIIDMIFSQLKIDVDFTHHFFQRLNDERNGDDITVAEIVSIFSKTYTEYGKKIAKYSDKMQAVIFDINTNINIPFIIEIDTDSNMELKAKTIMRKKVFGTSDPKLYIK